MSSCAVDGCSRSAEKRGWCGGHYYRWRKHGSPTGGRSRNGVQRQFLDDFVDPNTDDCVLWPFSLDTHGYSRPFRGEGRAHQIVCRKFHGEKPSDEHEVAHSCGNRPCINPGHVRWDTPIGNNADKIAHGRQQSKLTEQQVIEIRSSSDTCAALAALFDVSASAISCIKTRKTWDREGL